MYRALRFFSLFLVIASLVLLGADFISTLEKSGGIVIRSLDQVWALIGKSSLDGFKAWLENTLPAPVPNWVYSFMALPGWAVFGVPGVVLAFLLGGRSIQE